MTGYSGTPLTKKLGIKSGSTVCIINAPKTYRETLGEIPPDVEFVNMVEPSDVYVLFATLKSNLAASFQEALLAMPPQAAIWVAWPKRSSGVATDLNEDEMRRLFLPTGLVDNKVCAIDEIWSGLRFVVRKYLRDDWPEQMGRINYNEN